MANSIPANVSISTRDPYIVLQRQSAGEGFDVATPIQAKPVDSPDINIWSRRKPLRPLVDHPTPLTDQEAAEVAFGILPYKGSEAFYTETTGSHITISRAENINEAISVLPTISWRYARRPGGGDWKRMTDWAGYDHLAGPPTETAGDFILDVSATSFTISAAPKSFITTSNLTVADFPYLANLYFAVIIYRVSKSDGTLDTTTSPRMITADQPLSSGALSLTVAQSAIKLPDASGLYTYRYILCASTAKQTTLAVPTGAKFLPLPASSPLTGDINISGDSPVKITVVGISSQANKPARTNLDDYRLMTSQGEASFYGVGPGLFLHCDIIATSSATQFLPQHLRATARQTPTTTDDFNGQIELGPDIYLPAASAGGTPSKLSNAEANALTISASSATRIIIDVSALPFLNDASSKALPVRDHASLHISLLRITGSASLAPIAGTTTLNIHSGSGVKTITPAGDITFETL